MSQWITRTLIVAFCCSLAVSAAHAAAPYTMEEILTPPYPYGVAIREAAIADDGTFVAGAWDDSGYGNRDLWTYDVAAGTWIRHTEYWAEKAARLHREFERDLERDRQAWDEVHAHADDDAKEPDAEEFDAAERIEEFEESLAKQRNEFGGIAQIVFRQSSHEVFWVFEGRLYSLDLDAPDARPRLRLQHKTGFRIADVVRNADHFLLAADNDMYKWWPGDGRLQAMTTGGTGEKSNAGSGALSPDTQWMATAVRDYSCVRKTQIPDLLAENPYTSQHYFTRPSDTPETVRLTLFDLSTEPSWPVEVELDDEPYYQVENMEWSPLPGDNRLLVGIITGDTQHYKAYIITPPADDVSDPQVELAYHEHDDKWINWGRTRVTWTNDAGLVLQSEKNGTAGLYRLVSSGDPTPADEDDDAEADNEHCTHEPVPLYVTEYEVARIRALHNSPRVLLFLYYPDTASQSIGLYDLVAESFELLTPAPAWRSGYALNAQETLLAFNIRDERRFSELALLELPSSQPEADAGAEITEQVILPRKHSEWQAWADSWDVRFIHVPVQAAEGNDSIYREGELAAGAEIPVKLWLPPTWEPGGRYPLLIWVHGAGYSQTVTRDPGFYTLFHPWAADELGWVVAEFDYRGSEGMGRDWRVDIWGRLGHPETDDLLAVKQAMIRDWGADPERLALWGWSYGGFQILMTLGLAPGEFPVACAVAPVNRWENYNYWYSTGRLGHPAENEDEYERSAAETWLEYITDDLLIIHGLRDDNTLFQSIAQYLEKGHELGIDVELKLFPSDSHGIGNQQHYVRIYDAIVDYCEAHWPEEDHTPARSAQ